MPIAKQAAQLQQIAPSDNDVGSIIRILKQWFPILNGLLGVTSPASIWVSASSSIPPMDGLHVNVDASRAPNTQLLPDLTGRAGLRVSVAKVDASGHAVTVAGQNGQSILSVGGLASTLALSAQGTKAVLIGGSVTAGGDLNWIVVS